MQNEEFQKTTFLGMFLRMHGSMLGMVIFFVAVCYLLFNATELEKKQTEAQKAWEEYRKEDLIMMPASASNDAHYVSGIGIEGIDLSQKGAVMLIAPMSATGSIRILGVAQIPRWEEGTNENGELDRLIPLNLGPEESVEWIKEVTRRIKEFKQEQAKD